MTPVVSIILPTYQRSALLPRALHSVAAQTFTDWELIVVDDGSTDDTRAIVHRFAENHSRTVYEYQRNQGASAARNRGIELTKGEFIAFLDSDDEFVPHKLERQLSLFERMPKLGLVFGDYAYTDLVGKLHDSALRDFFSIVYEIPRELVGTKAYAMPNGVSDWLRQAYFMSTIVGMVRRSVLGGTIRFATNLHYAEEWLFYYQVAICCAVGFVDDALAIHHFTRGSVTRSGHGNAKGRIESLKAMMGEEHEMTYPQRRSLKRQLVSAKAAIRAAEKTNRHFLSLFCDALHSIGRAAANTLAVPSVHCS